MQEDKIGNSRMVQNGKKTRLAAQCRTAVCPEGPADMSVFKRQPFGPDYHSFELEQADRASLL